MKSIKAQIDKRTISFIARFAFYFFLFYGVSYAIVGLSARPGYHLPWVEKNLDYITSYKELLLNLSAMMISVFNYEYIINGFTLRIINGFGVHLAVACAGIGLISFWWAFVLAFPQKPMARFMYFTIGTAAIILLNIIRISTLAIVFTEYGRSDIDHHFIFNIMTYAVLLIMVINCINHSSNGTIGKKEPAGNFGVTEI